MLIQFLAAVTIKTIAAHKILVAIASAVSIYILGDQKAARPANRFPLGGTQTGDDSASALNGEMVHQVMPEHAIRIPDSVRMTGRFRIQQNACRFQRSGCDDYNSGIGV